jgi:hypothetical protein
MTPSAKIGYGCSCRKSGCPGWDLRLISHGGRAGARVQLPGSGYCGSGWDLGGIAARSVGSVQALSHGGGRAHRMWEMNIGIV